jgi:hypothetical protein
MVNWKTEGTICTQTQLLTRQQSADEKKTCLLLVFNPGIAAGQDR